MKKIIKKVIASTLALSLLLGNATALASNSTKESGASIQTGTYTVPFSVVNSKSDSSEISRSSSQFTTDALLTVASDGSATLEIDIDRYNSGSTTYYYPKNITYRTSESDSFKSATTLDSESFTVSIFSTSRSDTRPSKISLTFDVVDIYDVEIAYDEYKIAHNSSNSLNSSVEAYLLFDFSDVVQTQIITPTMYESMSVFTKESIITINTEDSTSQIYYSINNGEQKLYTGPFSVTETATVSAIGKKEGYANSDPATLNVEKVSSTKSGYFGPNNKEYTEGVYNVTVSALKSGSTDASSFAGLVLDQGTLIVDATGTGNIRFETKFGVMAGYNCYLEAITYYNLSGSKISATVLEEHEATSYVYDPAHPPKLVQFPILDTENSTYELNAQAGSDDWYKMYHDFDIYIEEFDETSDGSTPEPEIEPLPEVEDTGFLFGENQVEIEAGKYILPVHVVKAFSQEEDSMTNEAVVDGQAILTVTSDAKAILNVDYQAIDIGTFNGAVSNAYYYLTDSVNSNYIVEATKVYENTEEFLSTYEFPIINKALDGLYVAYDVINTANGGTVHTKEPAYIKLDFDNISAYENETFGSSKVSLEPAIYEVPVSLMHSTDTSSPSMAESVLGETAVLTIYNNKVAEITTTYSSMTVGNTTAYANDIKYYTSNSATGSTIDATVLESDDDGNPTDVQMTVIDNSRDGIYINLNISGMDLNQNAYIAIDYSNAVKTAELPEGETPDVPVIPETEDEFEDEELTDVQVDDGIYSVPVYLKRYEGVKSYNTSSSASMADEAIVGLAKATVDGEKITYTIQFQGIYITGLYGHLLNMWHYTAQDISDGTLTDPIPTTTISYYDDIDMYGNTAKFPELVMFEYYGDVNDNVYIQTYVDAMVGYHYQDAVFVFDWENAVNDNGMSALGDVTDDEYGLAVTLPKDGMTFANKSVAYYTTEEITNIINAFGDSSYDATIILELNEVEEQNTAEINVPREAIEALIHNTNGVVIKTDKAEIVMSNLALYTIVENMTGDVKFTMSNVELASENSRTASNDGRAVVDLKISVGNKNAHTFKRSITVKIPHNVSIDETTRRLGVYYIPDDENSAPVKMETGVYKNGYVYFDTNHFSTFAITHENFIEDFNDVKDYHWFAESIEKTIELGLLTGVDENTFNPNGVITTGMIVTVLHRLSGDQNIYADGNWYEAGMAWAIANGITDNENAFEIITREELAQMLYNYHENPELDGTIEHYIDAHEVSEDAKSAKIWATSTGVMTGKTSNTINSQENATRAELATILVRLLNI